MAQRQDCLIRALIVDYMLTLGANRHSFAKHAKFVGFSQPIKTEVEA